MDLDTIRAFLATGVPFNVHVGVELVELGDGTAVTRLSAADHLRNHVGTQHAAALFGVAEAASGAALAGALADRIEGLVLVARGASIRFTGPARGAVRAEAALDRKARRALSEPERADVGVDVRIVDDPRPEGAPVVATVRVEWAVRAAR